MGRAHPRPVLRRAELDYIDRCFRLKSEQQQRETPRWGRGLGASAAVVSRLARALAARAHVAHPRWAGRCSTRAARSLPTRGRLASARGVAAPTVGVAAFVFQDGRDRELQRDVAPRLEPGDPFLDHVELQWLRRAERERRQRDLERHLGPGRHGFGEVDADRRRPCRSRELSCPHLIVEQVRAQAMCPQGPGIPAEVAVRCVLPDVFSSFEDGTAAGRRSPSPARSPRGDGGASRSPEHGAVGRSQRRDLESSVVDRVGSGHQGQPPACPLPKWRVRRSWHPR